MDSPVIEQKWVGLKVLELDLRIGRQTLWRWRRTKNFPQVRPDSSYIEYWWPAVVDWMRKQHKRQILRRLGLESRPVGQTKPSRPTRTLTFLDPSLLLTELYPR